MGKKSRTKHAKRSEVKLPATTRTLLTKTVMDLLEITVQEVPPMLDEQWNSFLKINSLVEKIQKLEEDISYPQYDRAKEFSGFTKWLDSVGVVINNLEIADYGNENFGFRCKSEVKSQEPVMHIPQSVVMSEVTAQKSSIGTLIKNDPMVSQMGNVCLAVHLLNELCEPSSFWLPYLKILPRNFSTVLYFTSDEVAKLKGSPAYEEAIKAHRNIARQYSYLYKVMQKHTSAGKWALTNHFSYDAYRWAVSCTMTRINKVPARDDKVNFALIPGWDMCNHEYGTFSTGFDEKKDVLSCYAHRDFSAGEQFCIYYGPRSNTDFFLHNGFVYKDNPEDSLRIKMGVSKNDINCDMKSDFLLDCEFPMSGAFPIIRSETPFPKSLLAVINVICIKTKEELQNLTKDQITNHTSVEAWNFLRTRLLLLLKSYRDPIQSSDMSLIDQRIEALFKEEKKILFHAIEYIDGKLR